MKDEEVSLIVELFRLLFENRTVRVIALRSMPKISLVGISVGPFEEKREYEVKFWVARALEEESIAKIQDPIWDVASSLPKIHFTEKRKPTPTPLPSDFYQKAALLLKHLKATSKRGGEEILEYERARKLLQAIINIRVNKIIDLALIQPPDMQTLKNLTPEEKALYESIKKVIAEWKSKIL